jgi:hypothetical protein
MEWIDVQHFSYCFVLHVVGEQTVLLVDQLQIFGVSILNPNQGE